MTDSSVPECNDALSPESYRVLFEHIQDGVFVVRDAAFIFVNRVFSDLIGYAPDQLIGRPVDIAIAAEDRALVLGRYQRRLAGEDIGSSYEFRLVHKDGHTYRHVLMSVGVVANDHGTVIGTVKDITAIRTAMDALENSRQDYQTLRDTISDVFYRTDADGIIIDMSAACFDVLGYRPQEMTGHKLSEFYTNPADREKIIAAIRENDGHATQVEAALRHRDGHPVWLSTNAYLKRDSSGRPTAIEGIARDISERKAMEDELRILSTHDDLTGSYNRRYFIDEVEREMERARRYDTTLSLLIFDIDLFKAVNDAFGHPTGDSVLQQFSRLCRNTLRKSDIFARMGGEEFAALMPETDRSNADQLCERLRQEVAATSFHDDEGKGTVNITTSIGVTTLQPDDHHFSQLYARADKALYQAKAAGRNCHRFFIPASV